MQTQHIVNGTGTGSSDQLRRELELISEGRRELEQDVIRDPGPFSMGPRKIVGALCDDGKQRTATCSALGADTFFSIPARVQANGRTVSGYVTADDIMVGGTVSDVPGDHFTENGEQRMSPARELEPARMVRVWIFRTYCYGRNAGEILSAAELTDWAHARAQREDSERQHAADYRAHCASVDARLTRA